MTKPTTILSSLLPAAVAAAGCTSSAHPTSDSAPVDPRAVQVGLVVRLEVKPGHETEVAQLLRDGQALVAAEPGTTYWFAIQMGPTTFGIFDAFPDESGRAAHLNGPIAAALMAKAGDLLSKPPVIERVDVLAAKLSR